MFCCKAVEAIEQQANDAMNPNLALPGKKGICFLTGNSDNNIEKVVKLKPSWNYNWGCKRHENQPDDIEYVPMIWGGAKTKDDMQARIDEFVAPQIKAGTCQRLLCFNEPDKPNQSNMTHERCLDFWPQLEELGVPLVSPSCANPLSSEQARECTQGVSGCWMKDFMGELERRGHRCDYIGVHWYGNPSPDAFKKVMREIYDAYDGRYPLMITEFAVADWKAMNKSPEDNRFTQEQILNFMKAVLPWIEKQPWIAGYAWFPFNHDSPQGASSALFDADNKLTALGRFYRSVTTENPSGNQDIKVE